MKYPMIVAAAATALYVLSASAPAQASMANPALGSSTGASTSPLLQRAQLNVYAGPRHHHYSRQRYRHCWTHRYRVRYHHHWVWRTVRRCGWRYR